MGMGTYNVMCLLLGGGEYCFNCILCIYFCSSRLCMGVDKGTHLSTCLVYATCVMAFVACVNADEFSVLYFIL